MKKKIDVPDLLEKIDYEVFEGKIEVIDEIDYSPLTKDDYLFLRQELPKIETFLPTHLMNRFWNLKITIQGYREVQPCACKSSGSLWLGCIKLLTSYVEKVNEQL